MRPNVSHKNINLFFLRSPNLNLFQCSNRHSSGELFGIKAVLHQSRAGEGRDPCEQGSAATGQVSLKRIKEITELNEQRKMIQ